MAKQYITPTISLIDGVSDDLGFKLWMESKSSVVHQGSDVVEIGDEVIPIDQYKDNIRKMNMQYNNFPYYVFEIQGSLLFRDLLYNINKISQWAVSLRLMHSVTNQHDESNFPISTEYMGIEEWETAFDEYFSEMQDESRVDVNRVKMPYSLSSRYWIGINYRSLVSLLTLLKLKMPFFYNIYGKLFEEEIKSHFNYDISKYYTDTLESGVSKYISKDNSEFTESVTKIDDYYCVKIKMGLILYSQFIRQADVDVRGLYDQLIHSDVIEFRHKVFKGDTILNVTYLAHSDRIKKTISNRLCWFSQSDGDENDPCYWSKFINLFTKDMDLYQLMDLMPCKFKNGTICSCHYNEDIKFRDKKLQSGYIPCAIKNKNLSDSAKRYSLCNNKLNLLYNELTRYSCLNGLLYEFELDAWTSKLVIKTDKPLTDAVISGINYLLDTVSSKRNMGCMDTIFDDIYSNYALKNDYTCMAKGLALDVFKTLLIGHGYKSFLINFGGDIFGYNTKAIIQIEDSKFSISKSGIFSIFTSGNTNKRGDHIIGGPRGTSTTFITWKDIKCVNNILIDALATKVHAREMTSSKELISELVTLGELDMVFLNEDGLMLNETYCASPFFNTDQIEVRDDMISKFVKILRPDKTESSLRYDNGENCALDVVNDNIRLINKSYALVFPVRTNDLGTLFEVGVAFHKNKIIIKYYEDTDSYVISDVMDISVNPSGRCLFDCSTKIGAISMGYYSCEVGDSNIYYTLNGAKDNIMMSAKYNHVELINGKYQLITRDENERDQ